MLSIVVHYFRNAPCVLNLISTFYWKIEHKRRRFWIEVPLPSQENDRSCICVLRVWVLSLSTTFLLYFGTVPTVWYFFPIFLLPKQNNGNAYVFVRKTCLQTNKNQTGLVDMYLIIQTKVLCQVLSVNSTSVNKFCLL
jgi:hypothetical protein